MYCPQCGSAVDERTAYCIGCGYSMKKAAPNEMPSLSKPVNAPEKRRLPLSTLWAGLVAVFAIIGMAFMAFSRMQEAAAKQGSPVFAAKQQAATTDAEEAPTFATPEDAIAHFYNALAARDFQMALEACAVSEQAGGFDFPGWVDRLKTHMPLTNMAPSTDELFRELNEAAAAGAFANQIKMLIYSFFVTEGLDGKPVVPADKAYVETFQAAVNPQQLADLRLLRIDPPTASVLESEKNKQNFDNVAKLYGAQEQTERIVLYEWNGETYMGGFGLYRYASGWKICRLNSNLAGQSASGAAIKITLQAYEGLLQ